jgi:hypothetical protein
MYVCNNLQVNNAYEVLNDPQKRKVSLLLFFFIQLYRTDAIKGL